MAQLKDIKERIDSVKKTRKMTQAMKMVAAAKFKRYSETAVSSRLILSELDSAITQITSSQNGVVDSIYTKEFTSNRELALVITGDRGLCGGFNSNIIKFAKEYVTTQKQDVDLIVFGRRGIQSFKRNNEYVIVNAYEQFSDNLTNEKIDELFSELKTTFLEAKYSSIKLFYNEFKTAVTSNLISKQLFPVQWSETDTVNTFEDVILEPNPEDLLDNLCSEYIRSSIYNAFVESSAAEQGARMAAMDSATDNAGEMISDLTLIYNRQRQAQITSELTEIVAGADALVG